jgi:hypothetical protein
MKVAEPMGSDSSRNKHSGFYFHVRTLFGAHTTFRLVDKRNSSLELKGDGF